MILLNFKTAIKGSSTVKGFEDWINIDSMSTSVARTITVVGEGADRDVSNPMFPEFVFSRSTDLASPELWFQATCGKSLGEAEINIIQTAAEAVQPYCIIKLTEPVISSYSMDSSGERPTETFTINFTQISYQYNQYTGEKVTKGTPKAWNILTNEPAA